jgi:hypothetical protein
MSVNRNSLLYCILIKWHCIIILPRTDTWKNLVALDVGNGHHLAKPPASSLGYYCNCFTVLSTILSILCAKFIYILCPLLTVYICTLFAFLSHLLFNTQSELLLTALKTGIKLKQHSIKKLIRWVLHSHQKLSP